MPPQVYVALTNAVRQMGKKEQVLPFCGGVPVFAVPLDIVFLPPCTQFPPWSNSCLPSLWLAYEKLHSYHSKRLLLWELFFCQMSGTTRPKNVFALICKENSHSWGSRRFAERQKMTIAVVTITNLIITMLWFLL